MRWTTINQQRYGIDTAQSDRFIIGKRSGVGMNGLRSLSLPR